MSWVPPRNSQPLRRSRTVPRRASPGLLIPLVGAGNFQTDVSANLDFTQEHTHQISYGPNRLVEHQTSSSPANTGSSNAAIGIPGAMSNEPPAATTAAAPPPPVPGAPPAAGRCCTRPHHAAAADADQQQFRPDLRDRSERQRHHASGLGREIHRRLRRAEQSGFGQRHDRSGEGGHLRRLRLSAGERERAGSTFPKAGCRLAAP